MRPGSSPKTPSASPPDSRKGIGRKSPCFSFLSGAVPLHSLHNRRFLKSSAFFHRLPGSPCRSLSQTAGEWPVICRRPGPLFPARSSPKGKRLFPSQSLIESNKQNPATVRKCQEQSDGSTERDQTSHSPHCLMEQADPDLCDAGSACFIKQHQCTGKEFPITPSRFPETLQVQSPGQHLSGTWPCRHRSR